MKDSDRAHLFKNLLEMVIEHLPAASVAQPLLAVQLFRQRFDGTSIASPELTDDERDQFLAEIARIQGLLEQRQKKA